jgi:acetyl-CoA C-acetyltransferase
LGGKIWITMSPIARIHNLTVTVGDPVIMLEEPIPATRKAMARAAWRSTTLTCSK